MKTFNLILLFAALICSTNSQSQTSFNVVIKCKGNPILLFPGFGCTGQVWDKTVAQVSKTHTCYIFTFAGFGNIPVIEKPWFASVKTELEKYIAKNKLKKIYFD